MFMTSRAAAGFRTSKPGSPSIAKALVPKTRPAWAVRPAQQVREISFVVNPTLFRKVPSNYLFSQEYTVVPGHIHGELNAAEIQQVGKLKGGLSPAFWTQVMQMLETVQAGQPGSLGHAPDKKSLTVQRGWPVTGSFGTDYLNLDLTAAPWSEPYAGGKEAFTIDIGTLDEGSMLALFKAMEQQPAVYSLKGAEGSPPFWLWTEAEWMQYLSTGAPPPGHPNCCDYIIRCLEAIAEYQAPGNEAVLRLKQDLSLVRQPQDLAAVISAYFHKDDKGYARFRSMPARPKWPATPGSKPAISTAAAAPVKGKSPPTDSPATITKIEPSWLGEEWDEEITVASDAHKAVQAAQALGRQQPHYADFAKAAGLDDAVFSRLAGDLVNDDSIFGAIFSDKLYHAWGVSFFTELGKTLKANPAGAAAVLYHRETYGPITHVSAIFFAGDGRVCVAHHESINKTDGKTAMLDGLAVDTIGSVSASYNTLQLTNAVRTKYKLPHITKDKLPILQSLAKTGPPSGTIVPIRDFEGVEAFVLQSANQSASQIGLDAFHYGVDPSTTLPALAQEIKAGKLKLTLQQARFLMAERQFALHPKTHPPGAEGPFVPGEATNNCGRFTWVALLASKAPCTDGLGYSAAMDLADVADAMYRAGVLVDTDYAVVDLMRKAGRYKDPKTKLVQRDAFSFLALAFGWSLATDLTKPTVIPAPIRRISVPNQADLEKTFAGMWKRLDDMAKRNIDSFLVEGHAAPATLPAMPPPGPMHPIASEADWADVEAHIQALSDEDRSRRFISGNAKEVMEYLRRMKTHSFYALRDPKTHAITLLLQIELQAPAGSTVLWAEVGTSVIPSERKKRLGLWGVHWACAWARNRGARLLVGQHAKANTAVEKLLPEVGKVTYVGEDKGYRAFEVPLPEPDSESHWLEAFAPAGQSSRQPAAPAKK